MVSRSRDFTLDKYQDLCLVLGKQYRICTVSEYLSEKPEGPVAVIRHDVDRKIKNALDMAKREHERGIRSSYYFRYPFTFRPDLIRKIKDLGHEIGYHYEVLSKTNGDYQKAIALFQTELEEFRKICPVDTICMHGSPLSKYNNRDLWNHYDYHSYGILGEAFLSFEQDHNDFHYLTDTGRTWSNRHTLRDVMKTKTGFDTPQTVDTTDDLIAWISSGSEKKLYVTAHPERWSSNLGEWLLWSLADFLMNLGKKALRWRYS
jgi:hypothetical protein